MIETLVRRFYTDLWEVGDEAAAPRILASDLVFRGSVGTETRWIDGYLTYLRRVRGALGDYRCDIVRLVCGGDHAAARMHFHGLHHSDFMDYAQTGQRIGWVGVAFFQMRDRRLVEIWVLGDMDGLRAALEAPS
ncbi:MAG: ester cyclase [Pseudomonadota bacterium]